MTFSSIISGGGFTLGTYAAQDYDLSEAEKYYTKLAYDLNEKVRKVGDNSDWKDALVGFGADRHDLKHKPDNWYWGNSDKFSWDSEYDFDCYKLWSFLCAYYYDFDAADNGDIKYWEFESDTETLLKELFDAEYEFVYLYDDQSRWEELSPYVFYGGGSADTGAYYRAEQDAKSYDGMPYKYRFKPITAGSELAAYEDSEGYICIDSSYRVLDPNEDYEVTGFFVRDNRYYAGDNRPFYMNDPASSRYYFNVGGSPHFRTFWGWGSDEAWFLISPDDTHAWNSSITDTCMYAYYERYRWKSDCRLYYNVKQKKTFDEVIRDKLNGMSKPSERIDYYDLLIGNDTSVDNLYGNHKTLHDILPAETFRDYTMGKGFGYEMNGWNTDSGGLFEGITLECTAGETLKAPFDCRIKDIDAAANKVTLRKDDTEYWYDGTGGTKRDTEVTIVNAVLNSGLAEGDTLKLDDVFARAASDNIEIHIYIDTDGFGWDYIDPRLVLY